MEVEAEAELEVELEVGRAVVADPELSGQVTRFRTRSRCRRADRKSVV